MKSLSRTGSAVPPGDDVRHVSLPIGRGAPLPRYCDRRLASELVMQRFGLRISARTMERWTIPSKRVNGHSIRETAAVFAYVEAMLAAAPLIAGHVPLRRSRGIDAVTAMGVLLSKLPDAF